MNCTSRSTVLHKTLQHPQNSNEQAEDTAICRRQGFIERGGGGGPGISLPPPPPPEFGEIFLI